MYKGWLTSPFKWWNNNILCCFYIITSTLFSLSYWDINILIFPTFCYFKSSYYLAIVYRGSRNQRIIDVKKSLSEDKLVLHEKNDIRLGDFKTCQKLSLLKEVNTFDYSVQKVHLQVKLILLYSRVLEGKTKEIGQRVTHL